MDRRTALQLVGAIFVGIAGTRRVDGQATGTWSGFEPSSIRLVLDPNVKLQLEYKGELITVDQDELAKALKSGVSD